MFSPPSLARPGEMVLSPWGIQANSGQYLTKAGVSISTVAYPAAGLVLFVPFVVPEPVTITKLFWTNGNPVAGNVDVGIYDAAGVVLVSAGATAQSGLGATQVVDVTDTALGRGPIYYLALACSSATATFPAGVPAAGICAALGLLEQTGVTLPLSTGANPATFAAYTRAYIPTYGALAYRTVGP